MDLEGHAEEAALAESATLGHECIELGARLHALGRDRLAQRLSHANDGLYDHALRGPFEHRVDERAIDLQSMQRQLREQTEAGITRPEIVNRDVDPQGRDLTEPLDDALGVGHQRALERTRERSRP